MKFQVITLFPEMIEGALQSGVVGQAVKSGKLKLETVNPRSFTSNVHHTVDDRPFGGGDGMLMLGDPLKASLDSLKSESNKRRVIHLSPRGEILNERKIEELSKFDELVLISSRYAGVDQRFLNAYVDEEISIGDYVLSGGELAALVVIDAVARKIPGVLGNQESASEESFGARGHLEEPQYTRPREWEGMGVPDALLSGNHAHIKEWKTLVRILVTADRRPELLTSLTKKEVEKAIRLLNSFSPDEQKLLGLKDPSLILKRLGEA